MIGDLEDAMTSPFLARVDAIQMHMYDWAKQIVRPEEIRVYKLDDTSERLEFTLLHKLCFDFIMDGRAFLTFRVHSCFER